MPRPPVDSKLEKYAGQLGKIPDQDIAKMAGVSRTAVVNFRSRKGIAAYEGHRGKGNSSKSNSGKANTGKANTSPAPKPSTSEAAAPVAAIKRKPGRPPKAAQAPAPVAPAAPPAKRKPGRPPKAASAPAPAAPAPVAPIKRKPGRPPKAATAAAPGAPAPVKRKPGRPPKATIAAAQAPATTPPAAAPAKRKPGRPPKAVSTTAAASASAPAAKAPAKAEGGKRAFKGRKSKLDAYADRLGKVPDAEIAAAAGVTTENVRAYRARRGIVSAQASARAEPAASAPSTPTRATPAPAAKAATPPVNKAPAKAAASYAFAITAEAGGQSHNYVVIASDIADAVEKAIAKVGGRHRGASVRGVQKVAEVI